MRKWSCDRDVGNTFPECVALATAAAECEISAYSCVDGNWGQTNPYPCDSERFASEACHRRALKCDGADENGDCPTVGCTCYGQPVSYNRPEIIGKTCRCPSSIDCMRAVCPF